MSTAHNKQACHWPNGVKEKGVSPRKDTGSLSEGHNLESCKINQIACTTGGLPG